MILMKYFEFFSFLGEGGIKCPRGQRYGVTEMSTFVHLMGEGVKNSQNLVHMVIERPP